MAYNPDFKASEFMKSRIPLEDFVEEIMDDDKAEHDEVNSPKHYKKGGYECLAVIHAIGLHKEAYLKDVFKYIWRRHDKGDYWKNIHKAQYCLDFHYLTLFKKVSPERADELIGERKKMYE